MGVPPRPPARPLRLWSLKSPIPRTLEFQETLEPTKTSETQESLLQKLQSLSSLQISKEICKSLE